MEIGFLDDGGQGLPNRTPRLEERREIGAGAQARDAQLYAANTGLPVLIAIAVALRQALAALLAIAATVLAPTSNSISRKDDQFAKQMDQSEWPELSQRLAEVFATRTRAEWCELMEHTDVCFAPVLTMSEATAHPHNVERGTFVEIDGVVQPAPAPRFSASPGEIVSPPAWPGQHTREVLADWGISGDRIESLIDDGAVRDAR